MSNKQTDGSVLAVCLKSEPGIPKYPAESISLLDDYGVEGDYHAGEKVRHRYLARKDPSRKNIRQVLLIDTVILGALREQGIELEAGQMGENLIVDGLDLMSLPLGTRLAVGPALLELSEIRDPCAQLNDSHPDLFTAVVSEMDGQPVYKAGIFARILRGGIVKPGHPVRVNG